MNKLTIIFLLTSTLLVATAARGRSQDRAATPNAVSTVHEEFLSELSPGIEPPSEFRVFEGSRFVARAKHGDK